MNGHPGKDRLHDWVDELLDAEEEDSVRRHVETCASCLAEAEAIRGLRSELAALPGEANPRRDLWQGIEARIAGTTPAQVADVLEFPTGSVAPGRRRISLSLPQMAAAGIAIALLAGTAAWYAAGVRLPRTTASITPDVPVALVSQGSRATAELDQAVFELEHQLQEGRGRLSPETLRVIEESLASIDQAIREAKAALAEDPASPLLGRLLLSSQKNKLRILRQATALLLPNA